MTRQAHITGKVEYREGDGSAMLIPQGPCDVQETALDATLSWVDGDTHGAAAMPLSDFQRYVATHAIEFDTRPA